jgi:bacterioferritin-associated ferredoxin
MTAGAAQTLLKSSGAIPASRMVLLGTGPLLYLLAWQLARAGVSIAALLDTTPRANYSRALPLLPMAVGSDTLVFKGLNLLSGIRLARIRHLTGVTEARVEGDGAASAVVFRARHREERIGTDILLVHQGVVPNIQISQALGCTHAWDPAQLCWSPVRDVWGQSSIEGIFIAGDGGGIGGAAVAEYSGRNSAICAAWQLGRIDVAERNRRARHPQVALRRHARARRFLDVLYRPPEAFRIPVDDAVIVCRCEEVTAGEIRAAVRLGATGPNQTKAFLRCGMGPCQGRLCGLTVCEIIAAQRRATPDEIGYFRLRPPIKPIKLGVLAGMNAPKIKADAGEGRAILPRAKRSPAVVSGKMQGG